VSVAGLLLGIDLVEVERIRSAIGRWGPRFFERIFSEGEVRRGRTHPDALAQHVAGLFAAKEAGMKALGTGWRGLNFRDIVVGREPSGKPRIHFEGRAGRRAEGLGVRQAEVSITHTGSMAAAVVALLCDPQAREVS
jgi:holo-[acyl-carrier protein] synthase